MRVTVCSGWPIRTSVQVLAPNGVASRVQVFDTPPVKLQVTEYRMLAAQCPGCGQTTLAAAPAGVAGPCRYGPNVKAATALLACNGHMSIERAADLMQALLDAPVSTGFAGGLVRRVADRLIGFEQALKDRLRVSAVMHHDETPARVAGDRPLTRLNVRRQDRLGGLLHEYANAA
jgi:transposase